MEGVALYSYRRLSAANKEDGRGVRAGNEIAKHFAGNNLHIADNESAAAQRSRRGLNNRLYSVFGSGGFGRNRSRGFRLLFAGQPFGDHPRGTVHVREDVEQVGRLFMELRQPVLDIGGALLTRRRSEAQHRTAQSRRKFGDQLFADVVGISVASAKRTVQTLRMPRTVRDFIRNFG